MPTSPIPIRDIQEVEDLLQSDLALWNLRFVYNAAAMAAPEGTTPEELLRGVLTALLNSACRDSAVQQVQAVLGEQPPATATAQARRDEAEAAAANATLDSAST